MTPVTARLDALELLISGARRRCLTAHARVKPTGKTWGGGDAYWLGGPVWNRPGQP